MDKYGKSKKLIVFRLYMLNLAKELPVRTGWILFIFMVKDTGKFGVEGRGFHVLYCHKCLKGYLEFAVRGISMNQIKIISDLNVDVLFFSSGKSSQMSMVLTPPARTTGTLTSS